MQTITTKYQSFKHERGKSEFEVIFQIPNNGNII